MSSLGAKGNKYILNQRMNIAVKGAPSWESRDLGYMEWGKEKSILKQSKSKSLHFSVFFIIKVSTPFHPWKWTEILQEILYFTSPALGDCSISVDFPNLQRSKLERLTNMCS